ncbi:hypothetical protein [Bartonella tamiae]|uniref:Uncharacterized protein n=1 Tax=Bartonella tamiae Th239 TaxID=1094558 RepID=J0R0R2_9HYPH|nr:hypothetical protein [Bartonella tamiae]EJF89109.1 hypothetical protein ME5_01660 [Bartonella tamiae Th239]EJF95488.1 hypothetical protein MEG_00221 [Bartonella tamiae Th307]
MRIYFTLFRLPVFFFMAFFIMALRPVYSASPMNILGFTTETSLAEFIEKGKTLSANKSTYDFRNDSGEFMTGFTMVDRFQNGEIAAESVVFFASVRGQPQEKPNFIGRSTTYHGNPDKPLFDNLRQKLIEQLGPAYETQAFGYQNRMQWVENKDKTPDQCTRLQDVSPLNKCGNILTMVINTENNWHNVSEIQIFIEDPKRVAEFAAMRQKEAPKLQLHPHAQQSQQ